MLNSIIESGIKVSDRQLKRDIESLRDEFGIDIKYSTFKKGYFIENEELTFPYFLKLLEFSQNAELLTSYLKEGSNIAKFCVFLFTENCALLFTDYIIRIIYLCDL